MKTYYFQLGVKTLQTVFKRLQYLYNVSLVNEQEAENLKTRYIMSSIIELMYAIVMQSIFLLRLMK